MVSGGDLCLCFTFSNSDRSLGPPSPRSNAFEHSTISFLKCPKWGLGTSTDDPLTNWQKQKQKTDKYPLSQGDKRSLYKEWLSLWLFHPPLTPNLLNPNILAPMVQGFELRDLQFEAGSINDNYRVFILPCCKIVHSSLEIGLEEFHFYGTILGGSPYSNSCFWWPPVRVDMPNHWVGLWLSSRFFLELHKHLQSMTIKTRKWVIYMSPNLGWFPEISVMQKCLNLVKCKLSRRPLWPIWWQIC